MGKKAMWGGLTLMLAAEQIVPTGLPLEVIGAFIMVAGYVLYLFDK